MTDLRTTRRFAATSAGFFGPLFALPLLLDPYRWARAFGWNAEPETDVGLYFGRRQPPIEHAEIAGWSAAALATRRFAPPPPRRLSRR